MEDTKDCMTKAVLKNETRDLNCHVDLEIDDDLDRKSFSSAQSLDSNELRDMHDDCESSLGCVEHSDLHTDGDLHTDDLYTGDPQTDLCGHAHQPAHIPVIQLSDWLTNNDNNCLNINTCIRNNSNINTNDNINKNHNNNNNNNDNNNNGSTPCGSCDTYEEDKTVMSFQNSTLPSPMSVRCSYWASFHEKSFCKGDRFKVYSGIINGDGQWRGGKCVVKVFKETPGTKMVCECEVKKSAKCRELSQAFNNIPGRKSRVRTTAIYWAPMDEVSMLKKIFFTGRRKLTTSELVLFEHDLRVDEERPGRYRKLMVYVDSRGRQIHCKAKDMEAFTHFSYHHSRGQLVVCGLEGVHDEDGFVVKTPTIHSRGRLYGACDRGEEGIREVFEHHVCNNVCKKMMKPFNINHHVPRSGSSALNAVPAKTMNVYENRSPFMETPPQQITDGFPLNHPADPSLTTTNPPFHRQMTQPSAPCLEDEEDEVFSPCTEPHACTVTQNLQHQQEGKENMSNGDNSAACFDNKTAQSESETLTASKLNSGQTSSTDVPSSNKLDNETNGNIANSQMSAENANDRLAASPHQQQPSESQPQAFHHRATSSRHSLTHYIYLTQPHNTQHTTDNTLHVDTPPPPVPAVLTLDISSTCHLQNVDFQQQQQQQLQQEHQQQQHESQQQHQYYSPPHSPGHPPSYLESQSAYCMQWLVQHQEQMASPHMSTLSDGNGNNLNITSSTQPTS